MKNIYLNGLKMKNRIKKIECTYGAIIPLFKHLLQIYCSYGAIIYWFCNNYKKTRFYYFLKDFFDMIFYFYRKSMLLEYIIKVKNTFLLLHRSILFVESRIYNNMELLRRCILFMKKGELL